MIVDGCNYSHYVVRLFCVISGLYCLRVHNWFLEVVCRPESRLSFLVVCLYAFIDACGTRAIHTMQWQQSRGLDRQ